MTRNDTFHLAAAAILAGGFTTGHAARAEGIPSFFDAAWRGFDTGYFPDHCSPHFMVVADLDGDGDNDVVAARDYHWRPGISVLMNHGDGTYAAGTHYQLGNEQVIGEIRIADIDVDGDPDVVATVPDDYHQSNLVALWRNRGDGTFDPHRMFTTRDAGPVGLVLADFTGDGFLDAVTANRDYAYDGTTVSLLPHNGLTGADAAFLAPVTFEIGGNAPTRVATADINGDEWPDLAVGFGRQPNSWCSILINDQAGGFTTTATFDVAEYAEPFVGLADLDNDGDPDLVTGTYDYGSGGLLYVQRNDGEGTFSAPETYVLARASWPRGIDFGDINGDGFLDVLCAHPEGRSGESWTVLLSDGAGGFTHADRYGSSQNSYGIAADDVDGDGDVDVLSAGHHANALTVHLNTGDGTFPRMTYYDLPYYQQGIDAGDIDLDGDLDVVTTAEDVHILRNNGDGTFEPAEGRLAPLNPHDVKLRDLNGDGYVDILLGPDGQHPPYDFGTMMNNGDGTFAAGVRWSMNACGFGLIDAFDLDNDDDLDVAFAEELTCYGEFDSRILIARNRGDGTFDQLFIALSYTGPRGIEAADLDHDGNLDLVTNNLGFGIGVLPGNGDLTFGETIISASPHDRFTLVELNGDGELDLATVAWPAFGTDTVAMAMGNGDGTFATPTYYHGSSTLESLVTGIDVDHADVDLDGDEDVVITNYSSNDLSLFINNGDGTLQTQARYGPGTAPVESVMGDFTGDGTPDVATLVHRVGGGSVMTIVAGTTSAGVTGDVDGDGVVNFNDLLLILAAWGPCEGDCPEDLDGDGVVGLGDLLVVLANWS